MTDRIPVPEHQQSLVVVGTSVRKPLAVLQPYLQTLAWQELPPRTTILYAFVDDFTPAQADAKDFLKTWLAERDGILLRGTPAAVADFDDTHPVTHQWSAQAMGRVGRNKNRLLALALERQATAIWLVDSDLVCDRTTLVSLAALQKPIACAVYWTHWNKAGSETGQLHAAPQVWMRHPYDLNGRGMSEPELRQLLVRRQPVRVWGQGACSLINRRVLEAGVTFDYVPEVPLVGMMVGEDRHFCIRAEQSHLEMWADGWPDIFHVYHLADQVPQLPAMTARLGATHPLHATLGDLVNFTVDPLEPMPTAAPGQWQRWPLKHVRGRLGAMDLLPEVEEAVYTLGRGEDRIVPVHFPSSYPFPYLANRRRLLRISLIDVKPLSYPPVVEDEWYIGPRSGKVLDHTDLTKEIHAGIREIAS